jgi:hypothetical protein
MKGFTRYFAPAAVIAASIIAAPAARADDREDRDNPPNRYVVTNLTSDIPGAAQNTDPVLQNAWGVAFYAGRQSFLGFRQRHGMFDALRWPGCVPAPAHASTGQDPAARRQHTRYRV